MKIRNRRRTSVEPKASCGGSGCFIKLRVLPYGDRVRRTRTGINKLVKA